MPEKINTCFDDVFLSRISNFDVSFGLFIFLFCHPFMCMTNSFEIQSRSWLFSVLDKGDFLWKSLCLFFFHLFYNARWKHKLLFRAKLIREYTTCYHQGHREHYLIYYFRTVNKRKQKITLQTIKFHLHLNYIASSLKIHEKKNIWRKM